MFYFEVIINSYAVIRSNTERSQVHFTLFPSKGATCKSTYTAGTLTWIEHISHYRDPSCCPFAVTPTSSHPQEPLCPCSLLLPFQDSQDKNVDHLLQ